MSSNGLVSLKHCAKTSSTAFFASPLLPHLGFIAVLSSALGGLIVSAVLKYADSVLKGYATSASVILTGLLSAAFFGTAIDLHFMLAVVNVTCSIALYGNLGAQPGASKGGSAPTAPAHEAGLKRAELEGALGEPQADGGKQHA